MHFTKIAVITFLLLGPIAKAQRISSPLNAQELFDKGMNALVGSEATRSGPEALEYFRRSSELGFAAAQVALGYFYETGTNTAADSQQALEWYKKAAQQDDPLAEWLAAKMIFQGVQSRDLNEAAALLQKSVAHGNPFAYYLLGKVCAERGDFTHAAENFRKAAEQGLAQAQRSLALLLRDGRGVQADKLDAYVWLLASNDAGIRSSNDDLKRLEAELGSTQVEAQKNKARELEARTARGICRQWLHRLAR